MLTHYSNDIAALKTSRQEGFKKIPKKSQKNLKKIRKKT